VKYTVTFEVTECHACPLRRSHMGHGEYWDYCGHPQAPDGYDNIIPHKHNGFPKFCPCMKQQPQH
jgi:hypothetical protein